MDEIQKVLFLRLRKVAAYIRDIVNPEDFKDLPALTEQCNEIWENKSQDIGAAAAAAVIVRQHSPFRGSHRGSSTFRSKQSAVGKPGNHSSPMPSPNWGSQGNSYCFYHPRFGSRVGQW